MEVMTAAGLFTSKATGAEVPPPGAGFCIVTGVAELPAKSDAGTVTVSEVALTNVVEIATPFHWTEELEMKPEPVMVRGVAAEPARVADGETEAMAGTGLGIGGGAEDVPPPQPVMNKRPEKTQVERTHVEWFTSLAV